MGEATVTEFVPESVPPGAATRLHVAFATLPQGGLATFPLIAISGRRPGPTLMCVGGIHGDEFEGPSALWRLADRLDPAGLAGRVWIVPIAHTAAFAAGSRTSPIDGQNLARIFPGDPGGTHSFRLADALFRIVRRADMLVDCHSGGVRLAFLPVAGFYPAAGAAPARAAERSLALAKAMGLPHLWRLPPRAGVLSYEAMLHGVAATGGEVGGRGGLLDADSDVYVAGIRRLLATYGMLDEPDLPAAPSYRTCLDGDWELAPVGGFLDNHVALGDRVAVGAPLATIRSPLGDALVQLTAAFGGVVMGVRHLRSIHAGEWATCVARETPL